MKALVLSKDNCPYCTKAMMLLKNRGVEIEEQKLDRDFDRDTFVTTLLPAGARATFPQIWLDGKYIGGSDQLEDYIEETFGLNDGV